MEFQKLVEDLLFENNTERAFKKPSRGTGVLGGIVTNTGKHGSVQLGTSAGKLAPSLPHDGSWHDRSSDEDSTTSKPCKNNKMGKHTRGNSLRSGRTGKSSRSKNKNF